MLVSIFFFYSTLYKCIPVPVPIFKSLASLLGLFEVLESGSRTLLLLPTFGSTGLLFVILVPVHFFCLTPVSWSFFHCQGSLFPGLTLAVKILTYGHRTSKLEDTRFLDLLKVCNSVRYGTGNSVMCTVRYGLLYLRYGMRKKLCFVMDSFITASNSLF